MSGMEAQHAFAYGDGETPTAAIVDALAAKENCDPLEVTPLYNYIDPDALNKIFRTATRGAMDASGLEVHFTTDTADVTVTGTHVHVTDLNDPRPT